MSTAISDTFAAFSAAVLAEYEDWAAATPENTRLKAVATKLSGLSAENAALPVSRQPGVTVSTDAPTHYIVGYGRIEPAWAMWLDRARAALTAVEG